MSSTYKVTTIDLLRHGACEGGEIFRGSTDVALCDEGWQQMQASLASHNGWQQVFSSSLRRCRGFAEHFASSKNLPLTVRDDLQELHFGEWEGRLLVDVEREHGETLHSFWRDPSRVTPPGGETMVVFRDRVKKAIDDMLAAHRGEHVLVITHGAVIRLLLCEWLRMPMSAFSNIAVPYAGFSRVRVFEWGEREPWVQLCFHRGE
jgi:alpha-ribazole phosphatase